MRELNRNQTRRDELLQKAFEKDEEHTAQLFGGLPPVRTRYLGGCQHFSGLTVQVLEKLIEEGFVDTEEAQNDSPTISQFLDFGRKFPGITFIGYAVSINRSDYRLSIEGVESGDQPETKAFRAAWEELGEGADENDNTRLWWD